MSIFHHYRRAKDNTAPAHGSNIPDQPSALPMPAVKPPNPNIDSLITEYVQASKECIRDKDWEGVGHLAGAIAKLK
jgi:hypothetical protein